MRVMASMGGTRVTSRLLVCQGVLVVLYQDLMYP
jgi:hypothetical protein